MRIAILTSFNYFEPRYSLTGIVFDQARMLTSYGHEVSIVTRQNPDVSNYPYEDQLEYGWSLLPILPKVDRPDYQSIKDLTDKNKEDIKAVSKILENELAGFDAFFTHDWLFTGWELPFGLATKGLFPEKPWLHWIHSVPSGMRDWWFLDHWGDNHYVVYPNMMDAMNVAEQYRCDLSRVIVIPHIKDLRSWGGGLCQDTRDFLKQYPSFLQASITQLLPAGQDRLYHKRVPEVVEIFGKLKKRVGTVFLLVANQWATETSHLEDMASFYHHADKHGLKKGQDFLFTRDVSDKHKAGISDRMIRDLFSLTNLFIFPTHHESFGLVVPEAGLTGNLLVLNRSLDQQVEISGGNALYFDFGSLWRGHNVENRSDYFDAIAARICAQILHSESTLNMKTWARRHNNWNNIYREYYEPILTGTTIRSLIK